MLYKCSNVCEFVQKNISFFLFKFINCEHTVGHLFWLSFRKHFLQTKIYWNSRFDVWYNNIFFEKKKKKYDRFGSNFQISALHVLNTHKIGYFPQKQNMVAWMHSKLTRDDCIDRTIDQFDHIKKTSLNVMQNLNCKKMNCKNEISTHFNQFLLNFSSFTHLTVILISN